MSGVRSPPDSERDQRIANSDAAGPWPFRLPQRTMAVETIGNHKRPSLT